MNHQVFSFQENRPIRFTLGTPDAPNNAVPQNPELPHAENPEAVQARMQQREEARTEQRGVAAQHDNATNAERAEQLPQIEAQMDALPNSKNSTYSLTAVEGGPQHPPIGLGQLPEDIQSYILGQSGPSNRAPANPIPEAIRATILQRLSELTPQQIQQLSILQQRVSVTSNGEAALVRLSIAGRLSRTGVAMVNSGTRRSPQQRLEALSDARGRALLDAVNQLLQAPR